MRPLNPQLQVEETKWEHDEELLHAGLLRPVLIFVALLAAALVVLSLLWGRAGLAIWLIGPVPVLWLVMFGARSQAWLRRHRI